MVNAHRNPGIKIPEFTKNPIITLSDAFNMPVHDKLILRWSVVPVVNIVPYNSVPLQGVFRVINAVICPEFPPYSDKLNE